MLSKSLPVLLVVYFVSDFSFARRNDKSIARDYKHVEGLPGLYKFHETQKTWHDAKQVCSDEDASLFYPRNSIEAKAAVSLGEVHSSTSWMYVGIYRDMGEVFKTVDGKPISEAYIKWESKQPDNENNNEHCVHMNGDGRVNDIVCSREYSFICEKELEKFYRIDYKYIKAVNSFYKIHMVGLPWPEAKRVCALEGAILWYPDSDDEVDAVISFWNATLPRIQRVYVGLSDMMGTRLYETTDGKLISEVYKRWLPNQPDYQTGMQHSVYTAKNINLEDYGCICNNSFTCWSNQKSARCVYMNNKGYLDESGCTCDYPFICKKTLQSLEWNSQCNMSNLGYTFDKNIGKCYKVHTTPLNWIEAYVMCRREQSHLAVISKKREAKHLVKLTRFTTTLLHEKVKENYQSGMYHVGFHNQFNKGWQTVRGSTLDVAEDVWWDSYKPKDDGAQCGSMFYTGRVVNIDCGMKSFFICEHDIVSS